MWWLQQQHNLWYFDRYLRIFHSPSTSGRSFCCFFLSPSFPICLAILVVKSNLDRKDTHITRNTFSAKAQNSEPFEIVFLFSFVCVCVKNDKTREDSMRMTTCKWRAKKQCNFVKYSANAWLYVNIFCDE